MKKLTGSCLCGAILYEINGQLGTVYNCHCSKCRCWGGDAFRTSTVLKKKYFSWLKGEDFLSEYRYTDEVIKTFCKNCGTNLISIYPSKPDLIGISLGGLDQDPEVKPVAHIFVGSKAPWFEITDELPQYDEKA